MHSALPATEYCGTDPTDIRNDFPSHVLRASRNLWSDRRYRHMRLLQYPLLPGYGYDLPPSVRLLPGSRQLQERRARFLRYKHSSLPPPPVFPVWQMLHNFHLNNRSLFYFSPVFRVLCSGNPDTGHPSAPSFAFSEIFSSYMWQLLHLQRSQQFQSQRVFLP